MDRDEESEASSEAEEVSAAKVATPQMIRLESRASNDPDTRWLKKGQKTHLWIVGRDVGYP